MIASYRYISSAMEEVAEAIQHYNNVSPSVSDSFLSDLDRVIGHLRVFPKSGVSILRGFRSFPLHRYPFSLIYKVEREEIVIVALAHQSRRPDYWRDRV